MRTVLTRDRLGRLLRSRWLFAAVVLVMALGMVVISQGRQLALAADTRGATEAVSVGNNNVVGGFASDSPAISANGRFVAFRTNTPFDPVDASNDDNTDSDIYVRDTVAGTTTLISFVQDGANRVPSDGSNFDPSISASGRYIAFVTRDTRLVRPTTESLFDTVVICDRGAPSSTGAFGSTCAFTTLQAGTNEDASDPTISANGRRLSFFENDNDGDTFGVVVNLTVSPTTGAMSDPAATDFNDATPVAVIANRTAGHVQSVTLSSNGQYLVRVVPYFGSSATPQQIFTVVVNDLNAAPTTPGTRIDFAAANTFVGDNGNFLEEPAVSGNGRRIAFTEDTATDPPFVVHTVDRDPNGDGTFGPGVAAAVVTGNSGTAPVPARDPAFSSGVFTPGLGLPQTATAADDGRYLAFVTDAAVHNGLDDSTQPFSCIHQPPIEIGGFTRPLDSGDGPRMRLAADTGISHCDVVARDLVLDAQRSAAGLSRLPAELASPSQQSTLPGTNPAITCPTVCEGDDDSTKPVLDADGSAVAYTSLADNLLANGADNNKVSDAFKRTFKPAPVVPTLNFGDVVVHTPSTGTVTVSYPDPDSSFGPLTITGVAVGGTNAGDFTVLPGGNCVGAVLHPGVTCVIPIRFTPGALGARSGTLTVTTNTNVRGVGNLTGNGVPAPPPRTPIFQAAPDPLAFGTQQPFLPSAPKTVTVTNAGTAPLTITNVVTAGANPGDYAITANTCGTPVAPGSTCTVSVTFAPQAATDRPALLQFTDNATGSPHVVALTGTGTPPKLVASPPLARSGQVSQVSGTGWAPNQVVVITLLTTPIQVSVKASSTGTFTVPLVIFPHTPLGKKQLQGQVQAVPQISATIDFLVVPGSLLPPDFGERR